MAAFLGGDSGAIRVQVLVPATVWKFKSSRPHSLIPFSFSRVAGEGEGEGERISCQRRGFCPSCIGRRMADFAAHLVDRVAPAVPMRQWVLTVPYALRVMFDPALPTIELIAAVERPMLARATRMRLSSQIGC
jgi:hypothetical protein